MLKTTMAGLIGRVLVGQIAPRGSGAQNPQHPVEHAARILPGSPSSIGPPFRSKHGLQNRPLGIGEIHASKCARLFISLDDPVT